MWKYLTASFNEMGTDPVGSRKYLQNFSQICVLYNLQSLLDYN